MTSSLVGSEMCIRDRLSGSLCLGWSCPRLPTMARPLPRKHQWPGWALACLLYTSDAADDM
eukprot:1894844-Prorocentrum_lima.AAC.1